MKMLMLDYYPAYKPADLARFSDDTSCFDYDVVVWDPGSAWRNYQVGFPNDSYQGLPLFDESSSVRSRSDIDRRRTEFREFVESGRTLFVISRPPQRFCYDTGERKYSGTGRNRATTIIAAADDFWRALPVSIGITQAAGKNIEFVGSSEFSELWKNYKELLRYEAVVRADIGTALMKIAGTDKIVSLVVRIKGGGAIVLLPAPLFTEADDEYDENDEDIEGRGEDGPEEKGPTQAALFQNSLCDLAARLQSGASVEPLPAWTATYRLSGEVELRSAVVEKETQIQEARGELTALQAELDKLEGRKRLITGTGGPLEAEVRAVLEALGGEVKEAEPGRDDWKVRFPEGEAVVEVKGLQGSAGEKDAAQLEKWVASHIEEFGARPKGLLVVNGWRKVPIDQRTEAVFPDQMLKYSKAREHCLVTGLQLLGILQDVESNPERAEHWRKKLLKSVGPLVGMEDWAKILKLAPDVANDGSTNE